MKIIAEIGINHNGNLNICKEMILKQKEQGQDYVKFQKRDVELQVPEEQKNKMKYNTPFGDIRYIDYKHKIEFDLEQYKIIDEFCKKNNIKWFQSVWDKNSFDFIDKNFNTEIIKIPSAKNNDKTLIEKQKTTNKKIMFSVGMQNIEDIKYIRENINKEKVVMMYTKQIYPTIQKDINIKSIKFLKEKFPKDKIGYSGHDKIMESWILQLQYGQEYFERHVTLDNHMWGSDQGISMNFEEFKTNIEKLKVQKEQLGEKNIYINEKEKEKIISLRGN